MEHFGDLQTAAYLCRNMDILQLSEFSPKGKGYLMEI